MAQSDLTRRGAAALLAGALGSAGSAWPAEIDHVPFATRLEQEIYTPPVNIAAVYDLYKRMTAPIRVNGQGPFAFVVDTGSNQTVISAELASELGLTIGPSAPVNGVAGVRMAPTASARLDVGPRRRRNATLSILAEQDLGARGLLGLEDLEGEAVTLDFLGQALRIDRERGDPVAGDAIVLEAHRRSGQLTLVDADLAGLKITAFLDSGAQNTIGNLALRAAALRQDPKRPWWRTPILSVTGQSLDAEIADLPKLRIGGLSLPHWPVAFADLHTFDLWNLNRKPAILLGVDILSRFQTVRIDFARNEVRFQLPRKA